MNFGHYKTLLPYDTMNVSVMVKANSKHREELVAIDEVSFAAYVKTPPIEGRANTRVIELVAAYFNVSKSQVRILHGLRSRQKVLSVE